MSCLKIARLLIAASVFVAFGCSNSDKNPTPNAAGNAPTVEDQKAPNTYHAPEKSK
jgi:hypothetical protein